MAGTLLLTDSSVSTLCVLHVPTDCPTPGGLSCHCSRCSSMPGVNCHHTILLSSTLFCSPANRAQEYRGAHHGYFPETPSASQHSSIVIFHPLFLMLFLLPFRLPFSPAIQPSSKPVIHSAHHTTRPVSHLSTHSPCLSSYHMPGSVQARRWARERCGPDPK